jgi:hypothetical protein
MIISATLTIMKDKRSVQTLVGTAVRPGRIQSRKEHVEDDLAISALVVLTIALYTIFFVGLYRWNRHAPIFSPDTTSTTTSQQVMPWP